MEHNLDYLKLGASLYVPATHKGLTKIAEGKKYPNLQSVIIDTEDAISEKDLGFALENLQKFLYDLKRNPDEKPMIFIRPRNPNVFKEIVTFKDIEKIDGFVFPKFTTKNMEEYMSVNYPNKYCMPLLEKDVFDIKELEITRNYLLDHREKVLSIRIGATDILSSLNLRRSSHKTLYQISVISHVIATIVTIFKPYGFNISGPVIESFDNSLKDVFQDEVKLDLLNGLFGKTIIHPCQIDIVQEVYKVSKEEFEIAQKLLDPEMPAVFKMYSKMNEKATHTNWARTIIERAKIYGIKE